MEKRDRLGRFVIGNSCGYGFQKGHKINVGKIWSIESIQKLKKSNAKITWFKKGHKPYAWKGDKVGYHALHAWIARHFGKPKICEDCKTTKAKKYVWANISGEYKRDLKDFKRLCTSCHIKFDKICENRNLTKTIEPIIPILRTLYL